jgi:POT family proton-dependent oligopeptide transporter
MWIPIFAGYEILPAQVSAVFNPLFILLLVPIFNRFIYPWINLIFPLTQLRKIGIGLWLMVLAFLIATGVQEILEQGHSLHVGWQILACLILTASEVMVSVTCLEFAYTQAPRNMKSFVMALFLLTVSLGNYLTSAVKFILIDGSGNSRLHGSDEFWFWTLLMATGSALFIEVARRFRASENLQ